MAEAVLHFGLEVTGITSRGVEVVRPGSDWAFWLPRASVTWKPEPMVGEMSMVSIRDWLAAKHQQLSELASVASASRHEPRKDTNMTDRAADAGNGVLFRNDRREKPSQPEFKGEATIEGKSY